MRALACPASFKGALSAPRGGPGAGARDFAPAALDADECPVADGGEGTAEVLHVALGGEWREAEVHDPLGRPHRRPGGCCCRTGPASSRPPPRSACRCSIRPSSSRCAASSRGFGELIAAALDAGATPLLLCLGGSATVDGGAGARGDGGRARTLSNTVLQGSIASPATSRRASATRRGSYGPQKGASPADVAELERRLGADEGLRPYAELPGSGAAGGLGAGLAALGAELVPGADYVLRAIGFRSGSRARRSR